MTTFDPRPSTLLAQTAEPSAPNEPSPSATPDPEPPIDPAHVTETVQDLIEHTIDSVHGFELVAERAEDPEVEELARDVADVRRRHAAELQDCVRRRGEEPERRGSWLAAIHRWWIEVRRKLRRDETDALLAECERGERFLRERYDEAVVVTATTRMKRTVARQHAQVRHVHALVRDMRRERSAG